MINTLKRHRTRILSTLTVVSVLVVVNIVLTSDALAQATSTAAGSSGSDTRWWDVIGHIKDALYVFFIEIGGLFAMLGGLLLDLSINQLVSQMGYHLNGNIGFAINSVWRVVRDACNIVFIFSLIYLGIKTILFANDTSTRRQIAYLIIAALLINFSLLATKVVVDFSNTIAHQIVRAMPNDAINDNSLPSEGGGLFSGRIAGPEGSVSGAFMDRLNLSSYANSPLNRQENKLMFGFLMMLLMIIAGFVFAAGAVLLITRFVVLIMLLIFSPILFLGMIYPGFSSLSKKYWDTFLKNAFVAPAYIFMLYLTLQVFDQVSGESVSGNAIFSNLGSSSGFVSETFSLVLFFAVMAGFLIGSVVVAQKIGAAGANQAMKISQRGQNFAKGIVRTPIAAGYRSSIGSGAARDKELMERDRAILNDSKASRWQKAKARAALTARAGVYGGFNTADAMRNAEKVANYKVMGGKGRKDVADDKAYVAQQAGTYAAESKLKDAKKEFDRDQSTENRIKLEQAVADATSGTITTMIKDGGIDITPVIAAELSDSQFKAIMDDKEIDNTTKNKITSARQTGVKNRLETQHGSEQKAVKKASTSELKALGSDYVLKNAAALSSKQMDDLKKEYTPTQFGRLKNERDAQILTDFQNNPAILKDMPDADVAKLSADILKTPDAAEFINTNTLSKIADNDGISAADRAEIKRQIQLSSNYGLTPGKYDDFFTKTPAGNKF